MAKRNKGVVLSDELFRQYYAFKSKQEFDEQKVRAMLHYFKDSLYTNLRQYQECDIEPDSQSLKNQLAHNSNKKKVAYIFLPQFVGEIKNNFSENPSNNKVLITNCCVADILVLDDFGAEYASAWFYLNVLLIIFNYRFENNKKIIFIYFIQIYQIIIFVLKKFFFLIKIINQIKNKIIF